MPRVGQNRVRTLYMTIYWVIFLRNTIYTPYTKYHTYTVYVWIWPTLPMLTVAHTSTYIKRLSITELQEVFLP